MLELLALVPNKVDETDQDEGHFERKGKFATRIDERTQHAQEAL